MEKAYKDIVGLWKRVFGDDEDFILSFLERFYSGENAVLKYNEGGELVGMAFLPVFKSPDGLRIGYLYAVAVDERFRKKGIASQMIVELLDGDRCDVIATIPASESLRSWYGERFGFVFPETEVSVINNLDFDLGTGNKADDIFMVRMVNIKTYLEKYASLHISADDEISVYDKLIVANSGNYILSKGRVLRKNVEIEENMIEINLIFHKFKLNL